jgi:GDP-L-fucose synthase
MKPAVFVAGDGGMVGSAIVRALEARGRAVLVAPRAQLDLREQADVRAFFRGHEMSAVVLAAARVGGIQANASRPADFLYDNLAIQTHVIRAAHEAGVQRLLFLGSSCIYPRDAAQPMREEALLTGPLEPTNEPYAIAKISGIKLCESLNRQHGRDYRSLMPTNLYGPGDNFHVEDAHVIPALMARFEQAVQRGDEVFPVWGTGQARREFLHVDDLAEACLHVLDLAAAPWQAATQPRLTHLNVGSGEEIRIADLAQRLAELTGFRGRLVFDTTRPDGAPRKWLDCGRLTALGWRPRIGLEAGLRQTWDWYRAQAIRRGMPD